MSQYERLDNLDRPEVLSLLGGQPELNVVLLCNIGAWGMDRGESPFHGDYFGLRERGDLVAVGASYNLGSLFFHAESLDTMTGMGAYLLSLGSVPGYLAGRAEHMDVLLGELSSGGIEFDRQPARCMVLREVEDVPQAGQVRRATAEDVDTLVAMAAMFEEELFGTQAMSTESARELLSAQVERGVACVAEAAGHVVSKAEATVAEGYAAQLGGVFTLPEHRGRGYSTACVANVCRLCFEAAPVCVLTVHKDNSPAIDVYRRIGFSEVADWMISALF